MSDDTTGKAPDAENSDEMSPVADQADDRRGDLPPAAQRALAEAEARRNAQADPKRPREIGGRGGPEPTRFGDWEKDGIAHDF